MKISKRFLAAGASLALAASLAACGGGESGARGGEPGGGDSVVVGVKFDQPGLGLKEGSDNTGFDVEVARYVAKELGYTDVKFKRVTVGAAGDAAPERSGQDDLRHLLDHRRPQAEGLLRRPLLHRRSGSAGPRRQHRHHRT